MRLLDRAAGSVAAPSSNLPDTAGGGDSSGGRPTVALVVVGPLGENNPITQMIRRGHRRFRFLVISRGLPAEIDRMAELRRVRILRNGFGSFGIRGRGVVRWASFFAGATLRLGAIRADLVHVWGSAPVVFASRIDISTPLFCWAAFHEAVGEHPLRGSSTAWKMERRFAVRLERAFFASGRVRMLAAESAGLAADLRRHYPETPVEITPRAVDATRFRPDPEVRAGVRAAESVAGDETVAVMAARGRGELKGIGMAIEALAALRRWGRPVPLLWIAGWGQNHYRAHAQRLGVADRIALLGDREDMAEVLCAADMFVLPSIYETFSMAAHEAAACGLPLIATPVNGVRELIGDGRAGIVVDRDPASVAVGLDRLTADVELRSRMGSAGRDRAAAPGFHSYADSVLALYERIIDSRPGDDRAPARSRR